MAYLDKLTINGKSYDLQDAQLRIDMGEMASAGEKLAEAVAQLQTEQTEMKQVDKRQQEEISLLQQSLGAMKIIETAAGESLHLPDSLAGKLYGLKAYVFASQAGEGTPSATNIRPISPAADTVTVRVANNADMTGAVSHEASLPENMYGGYLDWGRGVFVQTHGYVVVDGSKGTIYSNGAKNFYIASGLDEKNQSQTSSGDLQATSLCDSFAYGRDNTGRRLYCSGRNIWFNSISDCDTTDALKAYLQKTPACIVYPLLTPVEHVIENAPALTAEALYPQTYITTTGAKVEAAYAAAPKAYVDKKIKEALGENL